MKTDTINGPITDAVLQLQRNLGALNLTVESIRIVASVVALDDRAHRIEVSLIDSDVTIRPARPTRAEARARREQQLRAQAEQTPPLFPPDEYPMFAVLAR